MPKIKIYENDLTTAGGLNASSNVVYIPGFAKYYGENKSVSPGIYKFNTVAEFKEFFKNPNTGKFEYIKMDTIIENGFTYYNVEKSQLYALAILQAGLPILFDVISTAGDGTSHEIFESSIVSNLSTHLDDLINKNNYDIKFITTGGYENSEEINFKGKMLEIASHRGDCIALLDHKETSNYSTLKDLFKNPPPANGKYGAMFTPWCTFEFPSQEIFTSSQDTIYKLNKVNMPGSLAYLLAFATSIGNNNPNWLAAAGASRGIIPNLVAPLEYLTEAQIDTYALTNNNYQGVAINPIAQINPYGVIVWGNRTLHQGVQGLVASSFLNIRHLCSDIKKTIYTACKSITFEQNSDLLWIKFKSLITPLLDQMQTGEGIAGYELKRKKSTKKATLTAVIRIYPIEAVEDFEMTVELADEATSVME